MNSVKYALHLFENTTLYNRTLTMKPRNKAETSQVDNTVDHYMPNMMQQLQLLQQNQFLQQTQFLQQAQFLQQNQFLHQAQFLQQNQQIGNFPLLDMNSSNDDKNFKRVHPYQRDRDKYRERDKIRDRDRDRIKNRDRDRDRERNRERNHKDYCRDERLHYNRDNNYPDDYTRHNSNKKRWSYH